MNTLPEAQVGLATVEAIATTCEARMVTRSALPTGPRARASSLAAGQEGKEGGSRSGKPYIIPAVPI